MSYRIFFFAAAAAALLPAAAQAELRQITERSDFLNLVNGRTLTRPFVRLEVTADGGIRGTGAQWEVTGNWNWQDGYFCRDLTWGGDDLGYNCQTVAWDGARLHFTSDKGTGDSAGFRLK